MLPLFAKHVLLPGTRVLLFNVNSANFRKEKSLFAYYSCCFYFKKESDATPFNSSLGQPYYTACP